jgi:hypothetical protein
MRLWVAGSIILDDAMRPGHALPQRYYHVCRRNGIFSIQALLSSSQGELPGMARFLEPEICRLS